MNHDASQIQAIMDSKGNSLVGSGACAMKPSLFKSAHVSVCANARASIVEKQNGADPTLPGPGQYINPLTDGRNSNGEVKAILSTQKSTPSAKFSGPSVPRNRTGRSMAKPGAEREPGPGQYIDPLTSGRGSDGEVSEGDSAHSLHSSCVQPSFVHHQVKAILSTQKGARSTVWFRKGQPRGVFNGSLATPGPVRTVGAKGCPIIPS